TQVERATDIDGENRVPLLRCDRFEWSADLPKYASGIVHQDIDLPAGPVDFLHQRVHGVRLSDVDRAGFAAPAGFSAQALGGRKLIRNDVDCEDACATFGQGQADGASETVSRARDDRALAGEVKAHIDWGLVSAAWHASIRTSKVA